MYFSARTEGRISYGHLGRTIKLVISEKSCHSFGQNVGLSKFDLNLIELDYCNSVWTGDIETPEKVQKWAAKILPEMKHLLHKRPVESMQFNNVALQTHKGRHARNVEDSHGKLW